MFSKLKQILYRPFAVFKILRKFHKYKCPQSVQSRLFLLNIPSHGNLGDHLLSVAEHEFFKIYFPTLEVIPVTSSDLYYSINCALSTVRSNDVLCFTGGGFLGSLYEEEERFLSILKMFPNNKIIVLPQTIYYENNNKGNRALLKARQYYRSHNHLYVVARDENTYNLLSNVLMTDCCDKIALTPDMALYLNRQIKSDRKGVLWCLRKDFESKESNGKIIKELKTQVEKLEIESRYTDTYVPYSIPYNLSEKEVQEKLLQFSQSKLVITDRLHGMIFSVITGTPVIALDNINGKVGQVYEQWLANINYVKFLSSDSQTIDIINQMLKMNDCEYNNHSIIQMYQPIIDFINA